jgi:Cu(I)/Ag(I) efflux system protein CusF
MTKLTRLLVLVVLQALAGAGSALAAPPAAPMQKMVVEPTAGEVRKLDKASGKITLKHGEIRNLGMPPMAMEFVVRDRSLIDRLKVGDRVLFKASFEDGRYLVTEIQPAK